MKKYTILPILALALGFAACDDVDLGTGIPVVNPELPAAGADKVSVVANAPAQIYLSDYFTSGENVPAANFTLAEGWPEGYGIGVEAFISRSEDYSNSLSMPMTVSGDKLEFDATVLNDLIRENFSKNPNELQNLYVRYLVSAVKGNESILLGGPDNYFCPMQIAVAPVPPYVIETSYYYVWSDNGESWSVDNTQLISHKGSGNVYDEPTFSGVITATKGTFWKIIPASVLSNSDFTSAIGVAKDSESTSKDGVVSGTLDREASQVAGKMTISGSVEMTLDLEKLTFSYKQAVPNFWMAGNGVNGTSWNDGQFAMVMWTEDFTNYAGYAHLYGAAEPEFKFSPTNAWNGDFGVSEALEFKAENGVVSASGKADGGSNIKVLAEGLYFIKLNYGTRDLTVTGINTVGLIGDFNGWGSSEAMTPSADMLTWKATVNMSAGQAWKFRMNDGWDINLGGSLQNLTCFGNPANLNCAEDGTYEITLYLGTIPYTATMVKK